MLVFSITYNIILVIILLVNLIIFGNSYCHDCATISNQYFSFYKDTYYFTLDLFLIFYIVIISCILAMYIKKNMTDSQRLYNAITILVAVTSIIIFNFNCKAIPIIINTNDNNWQVSSPLQNTICTKDQLLATVSLPGLNTTYTNFCNLFFDHLTNQSLVKCCSTFEINNKSWVLNTVIISNIIFSSSTLVFLIWFCNPNLFNCERHGDYYHIDSSDSVASDPSVTISEPNEIFDGDSNGSDDIEVNDDQINSRTLERP